MLYYTKHYNSAFKETVKLRFKIVCRTAVSTNLVLSLSKMVIDGGAIKKLVVIDVPPSCL